MTIHVPAELAEAVEEALTRHCAGGGCDKAADWTLLAPCGHNTDLCNPCALLIDAALYRAMQTAPDHYCHTSGLSSPWADFRWQLI